MKGLYRDEGAIGIHVNKIQTSMIYRDCDKPTWSHNCEYYNKQIYKYLNTYYEVNKWCNGKRGKKTNVWQFIAEVKIRRNIS